MAKPRILVTRKLTDPVEARLAADYDATFNPSDRPMPAAALAAAMRDHDALVPTVSDRIAAGMLQVEGRKMSKSLGNFFTVRDLLDQGVPGEVIRFVFLSTISAMDLDGPGPEGGRDTDRTHRRAQRVLVSERKRTRSCVRKEENLFLCSKERVTHKSPKVTQTSPKSLPKVSQKSPKSHPTVSQKQPKSHPKVTRMSPKSHPKISQKSPK